MKSFLTAMILVSAAGVVSAQQSSASPAEAAKVHAEASKTHAEALKVYEQARVVGELAIAGSHSQTKGVPFSGEEVNESVQTLADGNRIVRNSTGKIYRNSAGRLRREMNGGTGGMLGTTFSVGQGVSIVSPDLGNKYLLDSNLKTARVVEMTGQGLTIASTAPAQGGVSGDLRVKLAERQAVELKNNGYVELTPPVPPIAATVNIAPIAGNIVGTSGFTFSTGGQASKYESRTEELGTRDFEGVQAEGTRKTTTIPANAIGNERPIEIVYERWFSKDLGMVVYSKNTDPRFGEQTYKLINVVRAEPDPSLFSIPTNYKKFSEPGMFYTLDKPTKTAKTAVPAKAVNVSTSPKAARP